MEKLYRRDFLNDFLDQTYTIFGNFDQFIATILVFLFIFAKCFNRFLDYGPQALIDFFSAGKFDIHKENLAPNGHKMIFKLSII